MEEKWRAGIYDTRVQRNFRHVRFYGIAFPSPLKGIPCPEKTNCTEELSIYSIKYNFQFNYETVCV
jgi:hypothetical protein